MQRIIDQTCIQSICKLKYFHSLTLGAVYPCLKGPELYARAHHYSQHPSTAAASHSSLGSFHSSYSARQKTQPKHPAIQTMQLHGYRDSPVSRLTGSDRHHPWRGWAHHWHHWWSAHMGGWHHARPRGASWTHTQIGYDASGCFHTHRQRAVHNSY